MAPLIDINDWRVVVIFVKGFWLKKPRNTTTTQKRKVRQKKFSLAERI